MRLCTVEDLAPYLRGREEMSALETGYRLLDTAVNYGNEEEAGTAIRRSVVAREDIQVTTKIPGRHHEEAQATKSVENSLRRLRLDYVDLCLIHWAVNQIELHPYRCGHSADTSASRRSSMRVASSNPRPTESRRTGTGAANGTPAAHWTRPTPNTDSKSTVAESDMGTEERLAGGAWPTLRVDDWATTRDTLHMWPQIVGKVRLSQAPLVNHWWQVTLYVSPRGLTTGGVPYGDRLFDLEFDFCDIS